MEAEPEINPALIAMATVAPALLEWLASDDLNPESVERGRQLQRLLDVVRADLLAEALDVLTPFAFMASAYADEENLLAPVAKVKHQALTVGALRNARDFVEKYSQRDAREGKTRNSELRLEGR